MTEADSPEPAATPEPTPAPGTTPGPATGPHQAVTAHVPPQATPYGPQPGQYGPPPANPFVPQYREPWLNPAKKTTAALLGIAAAVVLLALGFLLGLGVGGGHGHGFARREVGAVMPHPGVMYGRPYLHGRGFQSYHGPHGYRGVLPREHGRAPGVPATPTPMPSTSHR